MREDWEAWGECCFGNSCQGDGGEKEGREGSFFVECREELKGLEGEQNRLVLL